MLFQIASFLFLDGIEPFFGRQFSMWHSVTVGQFVYLDVSCFMSSRSVFLYTLCVYSRKLVHVQ